MSSCMILTERCDSSKSSTQFFKTFSSQGTGYTLLLSSMVNTKSEVYMYEINLQQISSSFLVIIVI